MTTIRVPDIGDASNVTVIGTVSQGDTVAEGDTLIVLESDKASMEIQQMHQAWSEKYMSPKALKSMKAT